MTRVALGILDGLILIALAIAVGIAVSGGGDVHVAETVVHLRRIGNPLLAANLLGVLRFAIGPSTPLLFTSEITPEVLAERVYAWLRGLRQWLADLQPSVGWRTVWILCGVVLVLKLANAWHYFGFFSGDDVEVQEMTIGHLLGKHWSTWTLRSAFFPMVFVYPLQKISFEFGIRDTKVLVFAGRTSVAVLSTLAIPAIFSITRRMYDTGVAVLAAVFLAWSGLSIAFGSSELPRPVSTLFVLVAFGALLRRRTGWAVIAGAAMGVAAALRFSEEIFAIPAVLQLATERRGRDGIGFVVTFLAVACAIQIVSDSLYWGSAFASIKSAIDYTLVHGQSSRGLEPWWYYVTNATAWTDVFIVGCAVYGAALGAWRPALWAIVPLLVLSVLPHKEPRYLLPAVPYLAMLAAVGVNGALVAITDSLGPQWSRYRHRLGLAFAAAAATSVIYQSGGFHFHRSNEAVQIATRINRAAPGTVALEPPWPFGGHLYLPDWRIAEIVPEDLSSPATLRSLLNDPSLRDVAVRAADCDSACVDAIRSAGFTPAVDPDATGTYLVFRRSTG